MINIISFIINIYIWIIIIAAVISFLPIDRNHPIAEFVNRLTQPVFQFIRQKMPWVIVAGIDLSALLLIVGLQFINNLLLGGLTFSVINIVHTAIFTYMLLIIIATILSFIQIDPYNPIVMTINRLTQPTFKFLRQKLPFLVIGGIDLSPIVLIVGLQIIDRSFTTLLLGL